MLSTCLQTIMELFEAKMRKGETKISRNRVHNIRHCVNCRTAFLYSMHLKHIQIKQTNKDLLKLSTKNNKREKY